MQTNSTSAPVAVIGAGIGGLAAAMEIAARGIEVVVYEKAPITGGKVRCETMGEARIDAGPTVFTMRSVFEDLFDRCGLAWPDDLILTPTEVLARHAWDGHSHTLDLHPELDRTVDAIGRFAGREEARRYVDFVRRTAALYKALDGAFIRAPRPSRVQLVSRAGLAGVAELARLGPRATVWRTLGRYFRDARLRQLFARYATYCGSSPYEAPATLLLIAHVEREGVWTIKGGMTRLASVLTRAAERLGARIRCGANVRTIDVQAGRAGSITLADRERIAVRAVVCNADVAALSSGHFGPDVSQAVDTTPPHRRSLSAVTWSLVGATSGFPLSHHNVFFGRNYASEFEDILGRRRLPRAPTVYVCASDRDARMESAATPDGPERLFCLVNAPAVGDRGTHDHQEVTECATRAFDLLRRCGLNVDRRPDALRVSTPWDWESRFPGTGGALYGAACHGWSASFERCGARSRVPGLYLAGGSVHPGPGVPMAALSGGLAAAEFLTDMAAR